MYNIHSRYTSNDIEKGPAGRKKPGAMAIGLELALVSLRQVHIYAVSADFFQGGKKRGLGSTPWTTRM